MSTGCYRVYCSASQPISPSKWRTKLNEEIEIIMSPLCQSIERDGKSVRVDIYDDGDGKWILEVVDEFGNSIVCDVHFSSDEEALEEVFYIIEKEGILSLIGSNSGNIH